MKHLFNNFATLLSVLIIVCLDQIKSSKSLKDKIYFTVATTDFNMCFRRFNLTHQIGCSSERNGNIGTAVNIRDENDFNKLLLKSDYAPYIIILQLRMFNGSIIRQLIKSNKVNGIIVSRVNESEFPNQYSGDLKSPNWQYGLYKDDAELRSFEWNSMANELMFENIGIPIAMVTNKTSLDFIVKSCYEYFNRAYFEDVSGSAEQPKCSIRMKDVNTGAQNTVTCWRRSNLMLNLNPEIYCDPIGSHNVHAFLTPPIANQTLNNNSIILIVSRLDSFSMFERSSPGVDSTLANFVAVHAIAESLRNLTISPQSLYKNVLFLFLHGEAFDYMGSIRFVFDLNQNKFVSFNIHSIGVIIEIGQIGCHGDDMYVKEDAKIWLHSDPISRPAVEKEVKNLVDHFTIEGKKMGLNVLQPPPTQPLPPASLQTFLKHRGDIPAIFVSNHEKEFTNKYYNSFFDEAGPSGLIYPSNMSSENRYNYETHLAKKIHLVTSTVVKVVAKLLTQDQVSDVVASKDTINHLLYCFGIDPDCALFNQSLSFGTFSNALSKDDFLRRYVAVYFEGSVSYVVKQHLLLLAYHLGVRLDVNRTQCAANNHENEDKMFFYLNGPSNSSEGLCVKAAVGLSKTISPAFEKQEWEKYAEFPAWTESRWMNDAFQIDVFLVPSQRDQITMLLVGIAFIILSIPITMMTKNCFRYRRSYSAANN